MLTRSRLRVLHLVTGAAAGAYVYLPADLEAVRGPLQLSLAAVLFPVLALTGMWMWKGPALRRLLRRAPAGEAR